MKEVFRSVLEKTSQNQIAEIKLDIEGETYTRIFRPKERFIIIGAGHVSQPVCHLAAMLGFAVTVIDDRADYASKSRFPEAEQVICDDFVQGIEHMNLGIGDYVAIMTRGHQYDAACIRKILSMTDPYYLGMLGSKRRTTILLHNLESEGFERERLDAIHTPIGLDIGALTVQEIAVSIMAEVVAERRKNMCRQSKSHTLSEELFDPEILKDILESDVPKAFMIVYATRGSSPVKSGAFMTVDKNFKTLGTIGGGYAEHVILQEAYHMIGTKTSKCVTVDMSNDSSADMGMVCGGQMDVLIIDL